MNTEFFKIIASDIGLIRSDGEPSDTWCARVLYSAVGRMALASLWDIQEECNGTISPKSISLTHFKRRIINLLCSWFSLYPDIQSLFQKRYKDEFVEKEEIITEFPNENSWENWPSDLLQLSKFWADRIYSIYLYTGFFYHSSYRLLPSAECHTCVANIRFVRGLPLNQKVQMSGLGTYQIKPSQNPEESLDIFSMFHLPKQTLKNFWKTVIYHYKLQSCQVPDSALFLRTIPPFTTGYWQNTPEKNKLSLMKMNNFYYLYQMKADGSFWSVQLPDWLGTKGEYRRLAFGLLAENGNLPAIRYKKRGNLVHVTQKYLLPPSELNFLKLYSWPFFNNIKDFDMYIKTDIFPVIRNTFEKIGYQFEEDK